jgi:hypothetical protein
VHSGKARDDAGKRRKKARLRLRLRRSAPRQPEMAARSRMVLDRITVSTLHTLVLLAR